MALRFMSLFTFLIPAHICTGNLAFGDPGMIICILFLIIEANNCWGDLMDIRAKTETLQSSFDHTLDLALGVRA